MSVCLASGPVNKVQVKMRRQAQAQELPGRDPPSRLQRALSSQEEQGLEPAASG